MAAAEVPIYPEQRRGGISGARRPHCGNTGRECERARSRAACIARQPNFPCARTEAVRMDATKPLELGLIHGFVLRASEQEHLRNVLEAHGNAFERTLANSNLGDLLPAISANPATGGQRAGQLQFAASRVVRTRRIARTETDAGNFEEPPRGAAKEGG
eukprot:CAMPEP_0170372392 /NCGR_PEP_ID=MMETSP0117_2-20130122/9529_1 /TAXON_ID=400756 /ORGANISM="Durinskia baltica, Strain CSIRO CS-38" /LENGTH=158 /DNA_ID=CAMNT_0010627249 /DNA_START=66 /DNA_END=538 /DNA_ORIENTATION=-